MKRVNHLIGPIAEPENLRLAFWKARKGKNQSESVNAYRANLDDNLENLRQQILSGDISVRKYHYFKVYEPKERQICAAAYSTCVNW